MKYATGELTGAMAAEAADLELNPRPVRDKLDRVAIKLHLKEWQQLTLEERIWLRDAPCNDAEETDAYRQRLDEMIRRLTGRDPDRL